MLNRLRKNPTRRSAEHRRAGPGPAQPLTRLRLRARGSRLRRRRRVWPTTPQRILIAGLVPAVAVVAARRRLGVPPAVTLVLASAAPSVVAAATPRRGWRYAAVGAAYMWAFGVSFNLPYERPEQLRGRLRIDYPIRIDSLIGFGIPPTQRLQRALRDQTRVTALDRIMTLAYASWFVPHLVLAWLLVRHPHYVPRAAGRLAAAYHLTVPFYYLIPTAPPWWASEEAGRMDGQVQHVRDRVLDELLATSWRPEGNPWASMPSDHVASAAITAMGLTEVGPIFGALGWTYVAAAGFSVVYLGEHYVIDALVGLGIAIAIGRGEILAAPLVRRAVLEFDRLLTEGRR